MASLHQPLAPPFPFPFPFHPSPLDTMATTAEALQIQAKRNRDTAKLQLRYAIEALEDAAKRVDDVDMENAPGAFQAARNHIDKAFEATSQLCLARTLTRWLASGEMK